MSLPQLIEVQPLAGAITAQVTVPGSKSITNRALILAALSGDATELRGALWSEDTQVMVDCLKRLGFEISVEADLQEPGNRILRVAGLGGNIPAGGTQVNPLELHVGNAGTAARFLAALVCLGSGFYKLQGVPRMHERPQAALFESLRQLGYKVHSSNNKLPAVIEGAGPQKGRCSVSIEESSQFASALLLCAQAGGWQVEVVGENAEESPYVSMTSRLMRDFPASGGVFQIEPDASSASYIWGANRLLRQNGSRISVAQWMESSIQIDANFPRLIDDFPPSISRLDELGDSIMTAIVLAPLSGGPKEFTDLGRLRVQECERVHALRAELGKCGARVVEKENTLTVYPGDLHGAEIATYNDHRMAMCFAILGLKVPGIKLQNPSCVKKTFPNFFQKLASPAPHGLGATIFDSRGKSLAPGQLHAD